MLTASFRRTAVLFSLIAVLATSGVSATGLQHTGARPVLTTAELLDRVLNFLRPHLKEGCHLDLNGRCSMPPPPHKEIGCHLDPNGACLP